MKGGRYLFREAPAPPVVEEPVVEPTKFVLFRCLSCFKNADVLYEGSSYCQDCLKEKLRIGAI